MVKLGRRGGGEREGTLDLMDSRSTLWINFKHFSGITNYILTIIIFEYYHICFGYFVAKK